MLVAVRTRDAERLIDRVQHRAERELVEAVAVTVEMAFATELLARQARQRILHHPDIAAVLDRAGMIPRLGEAADRPRSHQAGAGRTVERDGRTAAAGGQMRHRGIRADIDGGTLEQGGEAWPVEVRSRITGGSPDPHKAVDIGPLRGIASFGRNHHKPALGEATRKPTPAGVGPSLVAIERIGMQDGVGRRGAISSTVPPCGQTMSGTGSRPSAVASCNSCVTR